MKPINRENMKKRITDEAVLQAYSKYEIYLKELRVLEQIEMMGKEPKDIELKQLYRNSGLSSKQCQQRFQKFWIEIKKIKQTNPDIDLRDISTSEGRDVVSGIIAEYQNHKNFKAADLFDVAMAENLPLYIALMRVNEKKESKESCLVRYDLSEEQFDKIQERYQRYKKSEMIEEFNNMCKRTDGNIPSEFVIYAAAALDDRPVNALEALERLDIVKQDENIKKYKKDIEVHEVSQLVKDLIRKNPNIKDPDAEINKLEIDAYEKTLEHAKRLAIEAEGKADLRIVGENMTPKRIVLAPDDRRKVSGGEER